MGKMKLYKPESGFVYNFACVHPYFSWTYTHVGVRYIRVDFLVWTSHEDECLPKISKCGNFLYFSQKIPERFLEMMRQFRYYTDLDGTPADNDTALIQRGVELVTGIKEAFNHEEISPVLRLKLPFPVQQDFEDPYRQNLPGYELSSYPHERDPNRFFYVFSVGLKDAAMPRKKAAPGFQQRAWAAPPAAGAAGGGGGG